MDDASDRRQIRKAEKLAREKAERVSATLAWVMGTKQGREWIYDLLEGCHIGSSSFTPNPYISAFRAGEQNIGIQLWSAIQQACPDLYIMMMGEAHERSSLGNQPDRNQSIGGRDDSGTVQSEYEPGSDDEAGTGEDGRQYENK